MLKKPLPIFLILSISLATIFFLFPINLFDGEIVYKELHREYIVQTPLSLSYFIGIGFEDAEMEDVQAFYLTTKGWVMAFVYTLGFPALLAYKVHLRNK